MLPLCSTRGRASGRPEGRWPDRRRTWATSRPSRTSTQWEDVDGDGQIVIGAEQWPGCLNPVTECANSSWYLWTTAFKVLPLRWDTTSERRSRPTNLVVGEPVVEIS